MNEQEISIPDDFNWLIYLELNPDLPKNISELDCIIHYKNNGYHEKRPYKKQPIPIDLNDFDWNIYKQLNQDLPQNLHEDAYKNHFLMHGIREKRQYKIEKKIKFLFENNYIFFFINKIGLLFLINETISKELELNKETIFEIDNKNLIEQQKLNKINELFDFELFIDMMIRSDLTKNKTKLLDKSIIDFIEYKKMFIENIKNIFIFEIQDNKIFLFQNVSLNIYKNIFEIEEKENIYDDNNDRRGRLINFITNNFITNKNWNFDYPLEIYLKNIIIINYVFEDINFFNFFYQLFLLNFTTCCSEKNIKIIFITKLDYITLKKIENNTLNIEPHFSEHILVIKYENYEKIDFKTNILITVKLEQEKEILFNNINKNCIYGIDLSGKNIETYNFSEIHNFIQNKISQ